MRKSSTFPIVTLLLATIATLFTLGTAQAKNDKHENSLPPGLEKKVQRGGELPPGWQKKLRRGDILDLEIYRYGIKRPANKNDRYEWLDIDNESIKVLKNTREIIEILTK